MHSCKAEDYYTDIITAPPSRKVILIEHNLHIFYNSTKKMVSLQAVSNREIEIQTEDEQTFLARQQEVLKAGGQVRSESPLRSQASKALPRTPGSGSQNSPTRKVKSIFNHITFDWFNTINY